MSWCTFWNSVYTRDGQTDGRTCETRNAAHSDGREKNMCKIKAVQGYSAAIKQSKNN